MNRKVNLFAAFGAGCMALALLAMPILAHAGGGYCATDTVPGCTCNPAGYNPDNAAADSTGTLPGTVQPGDDIVSTEDLTDYGQ